MKTELDAFQIYDNEDIAALCRIWLGKPDESTMPEVLRALGPAKDRYADLDEDRQEEFRKRVGKFLHTYTYVTQLIRLDDRPLFELDTYLTFLYRELAPERKAEEPIDGLIAVTQLRIENKGRVDIRLTGEEPVRTTPEPSASARAATTRITCPRSSNRSTSCSAPISTTPPASSSKA
ncbi:hypothetical protein [Bifidobacterium platyrrhinorum]|uniref:Uncharacterized protein n=1 Tax=Bifidobacterium platyrrhinorum TaxID=2661628 RepID=A0A6L9SPW0_9BIFI|nr:hypothetical protein [Bifidobacterium platyrrhinorum]NEG54494.1 hypothetical protein [Bifidobacterium platyrrhinorum]